MGDPSTKPPTAMFQLSGFYCSNMSMRKQEYECLGLLAMIVLEDVSKDLN